MKRTVWFIVGILLAAAIELPSAQTTTRSCQVTVSSATSAVTISCPAASSPTPPAAPTIVSLMADQLVITPGSSTTLRWTLGGGAIASQSLSPGGSLSVNARSATVQPASTTTYTLQVNNATSSDTENITITVAASPPSGTIWSFPVDPIILGTCSAAIHDSYTVEPPIPDGFRYRTWHPRVDPGSGCEFAHEHGADPSTIDNEDIQDSLEDWPIMFGYIARRMPMPGEPDGHREPDEGFKVFISEIGDENDEGRTNATDSLSTFHMGSGGPARATMPHHSNDQRIYNPDVGFVHTQLMMETGNTMVGVCDPRRDAPTKDGLVIGQPCKVNSTYEIWTTLQEIRATENGDYIYRVFAVPAIFDPLTAFDPKFPTQVIPVTASSVNTILNFPSNDRSYYRGCDRESYAQVGDSQNEGGAAVRWTGPTGVIISESDPTALKQTIPTVNVLNHLSGLPDNRAFKVRIGYCGSSNAQRLRLSLKN